MILGAGVDEHSSPASSIVRGTRLTTVRVSWRAASLLVLFAACGGGTSAPSTTVDQGGCAMTEAGVQNEGWVHVVEGSQVTYRHNPPASGPHYPVWARYQSYTSAVARPYWVHNVEHGAIVA